MKQECKVGCKYVLAVLGILNLLAALAIGILVYRLEYRIAVVDTAQSADQAYTVILQSRGEPALFGRADGRLILQHHGKTVSSIDFDIADDGGNIRPSTWRVSWNPDLVAIMLSGSEQQDELILLYYSGRISRRQLSTRYGEPLPASVPKDDANPQDRIDAYAQALFSDEPEVTDGYLAIYAYLTGEETDADAVQYGPKATTSKLVVSEDDSSVTCLVYDRKSTDGTCCLYAYYVCPKEADGSWSYLNGEMRDIFAYAYESGEVISSGKTDWGEQGTRAYQEITGEP